MTKRQRAFKRADPFYTSARWRMARKACLERDKYWCCRCKRHPAYVVHHITPREVAPERELDLDNLESLCAACHNAEHPEKGAKTRMYDKQPSAPGGPPDLTGLRIYQPK